MDSQPAAQVLEHDDDVPLGIGGQTKIQLEPDDYDRLLTAAARDAEREAAERESNEDEADAAFRRTAPEPPQLTDSPDGEPLKQFAANLSRDVGATPEEVDERAQEDPFEAFSRLPRRATAPPAASQTGSAALAPTIGSRRHTRRLASYGQRRGRLRLRPRSVIAALSAIAVLALVTVLLDHGHQAPAARQAASSSVASVHPLSDPLMAAREKLAPSVDGRIQQRRASATAARVRRAQHARAAAAARARQHRLKRRRDTQRTHHHPAATGSAPSNTASAATDPQTVPAPAQPSTPTSTATTSASGAAGSSGTTTSSSHRPLYGAHGTAGLGHTG